MSGGFAEMLRDIERRGSARLGAKLPSWAGLDIEVPSSLNFQQCSGESAARYKASLVPSGSRVADLTGGLGVDSWAFAQRASAIWYNERDVALKAAAERNFGVLGLSNVSFNSFDISPESRGWQDALKEFAPDLIYLDPARRDAAGRKVFLLEECSPDVLALMPVLLNLAPTVMVKVSPMADITMLRRRLEGMLSELHVVGADGECKELLCICGGASFSGPMPEEAQARIVLAEDGIVYSGSCGKCSPGIAPAPLSPKFYGPRIIGLPQKFYGVCLLIICQSTTPMLTLTLRECLVPNCGITSAPSDASTTLCCTPSTSLPNTSA